MYVVNMDDLTIKRFANIPLSYDFLIALVSNIQIMVVHSLFFFYSGGFKHSNNGGPCPGSGTVK